MSLLLLDEKKVISNEMFYICDFFNKIFFIIAHVNIFYCNVTSPEFGLKYLKKKKPNVPKL